MLLINRREIQVDAGTRPNFVIFQVYRYRTFRHISENLREVLQNGLSCAEPNRCQLCHPISSRHLLVSPLGRFTLALCLSNTPVMQGKEKKERLLGSRMGQEKILHWNKCPHCKISLYPCFSDSSKFCTFLHFLSLRE